MHHPAYQRRRAAHPIDARAYTLAAMRADRARVQATDARTGEAYALACSVQRRHGARADILRARIGPPIWDVV